MAKSPKLKGVWERISAPQAVSERRLRKFHFLPISMWRLAQDVKVKGFNYRSLRPAEILVASKECQNPKYSYIPPSPLRKTCMMHDKW